MSRNAERSGNRRDAFKHIPRNKGQHGDCKDRREWLVGDRSQPKPARGKDQKAASHCSETEADQA